MQPIRHTAQSDTDQKNAVTLKAFFNITQKSALTSEQERTLLGVLGSTDYHWKNKMEAANKWIKKPNTAPLFNGKSALELMQGHVIDLADVRRYLDAERGW